MKADTNYIYILLAVLYVIYSIIKAGKKINKNLPPVKSAAEESPATSPVTQPFTQEQKPAQPQREQNKGDDFKKILEDLLGGVPEKQSPVLKPQPAKTFTRSTTAKSSNSNIQYGKEAKKPENILRPPFSRTSAEILSEHIPEEETHLLTDEFDIRHAVIYSEILRRPEY